MIKIRNLLVMAVVVALFLSCGPWREQRKPKTQSSENPKIDSTFDLSLVPVADGGIYAVDEVHGVVWYVSNGKALRITALKADFINKIVPAVEGGAYVHVLNKGPTSALWYLKGETATKIEEGASTAQFKEIPRSTESWLWAMWQSERLRRENEERLRRENEEDRERG